MLSKQNRQMPKPQIINLLEKVTQRFSEEHRNAQGSAGSPEADANLSNLLLLQTLPHSPAGSCPGRDLSLTPFTASVTSGPDPCSSGPW